jgi:hypothetical protein
MSTSLPTRSARMHMEMSEACRPREQRFVRTTSSTSVYYTIDRICGAQRANGHRTNGGSNAERMMHDPAKSMPLKRAPIQDPLHFRKVPDFHSFPFSRARQASGAPMTSVRADLLAPAWPGDAGNERDTATTSVRARTHHSERSRSTDETWPR